MASEPPHLSSEQQPTDENQCLTGLTPGPMMACGGRNGLGGIPRTNGVSGTVFLDIAYKGENKLSELKRKLVSSFINRFWFRVGYQERLGQQQFFYNAFRALTFNGITGDYLEFGCWGGRTFAMAYTEAVRHGHNAKLCAFDSFQGLPAQAGTEDEQPIWVAGTMAITEGAFHSACAANGIPRSRYAVVPGYYETFLPQLGPSDPPVNVALIYIDCDLYSSTMSVLDFLDPRLKHGAIIAFDDYFCWSENQISGERRAMLEFFSGHARWRLVPYLPFGWHGQSFVIEDKNLVDKPGLPTRAHGQVTSTTSPHA